MFTGIIQGLGKVKEFSSGKLTISTNLNFENCKIGSSISCNGVCLTLVDIKQEENIFNIIFNLGEETILRSNFANENLLSTNINLEKSLKIGDEISGHFVYGHIDLVTKIIKINRFKNSWEFIFEKKFKDKSIFIVEKGSITINGISLTIANVDENSFSISIIPHTYLNTNLQYSKTNDLVNIEFDYLARYILNKNEKK
tara:strand:- start:578 stop:1174 length:597 start_codon:yes stop_codon:yes gene_type:complete